MIHDRPRDACQQCQMADLVCQGCYRQLVWKRKRQKDPLSSDCSQHDTVFLFSPQLNLNVFFLNLNHVCEYVCLVSNCLSPLCDCRFLRAAGWPGDLIGWWRGSRWLLIIGGGGGGGGVMVEKERGREGKRDKVAGLHVCMLTYP